MPYKDIEKQREKSRKYYEANKEKLREYRQSRREINNAKRRERYYNNKEQESQRNKEYYKRIMSNEETRKKFRETANRWEREKRKTDPVFRVRKNLSRKIRRTLKELGGKKSVRTINILGTSYSELRSHIESLWEPWMNWDNYGLYDKDKFYYGWDIDHIVPTATAKTIDEVYALNHYTNLKPLCSRVNRDIKKDSLDFDM